MQIINKYDLTLSEGNLFSFDNYTDTQYKNKESKFMIFLNIDQWRLALHIQI